MSNIIRLVRNEMLKIWRKKRFFAVLLILLVLIPIFTYAQLRVTLDIREQMGTTDWRIQAQQQIQDYTNRMASPRIPEEWKKPLKVSVQKLNYHLQHDIDPSAPNAVTFTRSFLANATTLFLPLLVMVIASDLVSSERTSGTIKMLLTRPVKRWRVLLSKYLALGLYIGLIVIATTLLCYLISGIAFGYEGWRMPVLIGFDITNGSDIVLDHVRMIEHWQLLFYYIGLTWFSCLVTGVLALMVSVLVRSTAASMGIMLAALITGSLLLNMASSWESAKYLFMVNLSTHVYLTGGVPPVEGMSLPFSLLVLSIWAVIAFIISFFVFTRQDITN